MSIEFGRIQKYFPTKYYSRGGYGFVGHTFLKLEKAVYFPVEQIKR
jgi:hypothetical protein